MQAPGSLADRGARLLAASIDELILLGIALPALVPALLTPIATQAAVLDMRSDLTKIDLLELGPARTRPGLGDAATRSSAPSIPSSA